MNQRGFAPLLIILGVVLVLGIVVGVYYFGKIQPSPSVFSPLPIAKVTLAPLNPQEIANWKTYTDTIANISFKYPPDRWWRIDETTLNSSNYHIVFYPILPVTLRGIQIDVLPNPAKTDLLTYIKTKASNDPTNWYWPQSTQSLNLSGLQAIKAEQVVELDGEGKTALYGPVAFIAGDNNVIEIKYGLHSVEADKSDEAELKIFDQILSNFKILDPSRQVTNPLVSKPDNYQTELQGYPIYPNANFLRKEQRPPVSEIFSPCQGNSSPACNQNTTNYIFKVDATKDQTVGVYIEDRIHDWYTNKENLLGWKQAGGAQGISTYKKGDQSFTFLWIGSEFTIRVASN